MSHREVACLAFAVAGFLHASGLTWANDAVLDREAAKKGQVTYVRYCVSCHGQGARGDGPLAGDLRAPVPDLTSLASRSGGAYPFDRVTRIIRSGESLRAHGTVDMPAWGEAFKKTGGTDEKTVDAAIRNLNHYLWSVQNAGK